MVLTKPTTGPGAVWLAAELARLQSALPPGGTAPHSLTEGALADLHERAHRMNAETHLPGAARSATPDSAAIFRATAAASVAVGKRDPNLERHAVIDVGTWGAKLLVVDGHGRTVAMRSITTGLGEGVSAGGVIPEINEQRAVLAIAKLADIAETLGARRAEIEVIATACVRNSVNGAQVLARIGDTVGTTHTRAVSGDDEAYLAYAGVTSELAPDAPAAVLDIGGGSFQLARGVGMTLHETTSRQVGVYRVSELYRELGRDARRVSERLALDAPVPPLSQSERMNLRAVGWDARYFGMRLGTDVLTSAALTQLRETFAACPTRDERAALLTKGLSAEQCADLSLVAADEVNAYADAVEAALTLFTHVLDGSGAPSVTVSDRDTRHAVMAERIAANKE